MGDVVCGCVVIVRIGDGYLTGDYYTLNFSY